MFGDVILIDSTDGAKQARRLPFGDTGGRNEAWLRDTLFHHPEIRWVLPEVRQCRGLPIQDLDPSFGPLIPLCCELRTKAGPIDVVYVNPQGKLTLVECKLWRNPESRRKVIAQILDYARAISQWTYADLQAEVSAATGKKGNVPFEQARLAGPDIEEHRFIDAVTRALRTGRFMLVIAGDGIREDISGITQLIERNASLSFGFGLVEVALYDLGGNGLAVQPRVVARTHNIERTIFIIEGGGEASVTVKDDYNSADDEGVPEGKRSAQQEEYRRWWTPILDMQFDNPEQESPILRWPNNVRMPLPFRGVWMTAYRLGKTVGVWLSGNSDSLNAFWDKVGDLSRFAEELPQGTQFQNKERPALEISRPNDAFANDDEQRAWLSEVLNQYSNFFQSRLI